MSLLVHYGEALELTKAQTAAIRTEEWENLVRLLARRELCLAEAEKALARAGTKEKQQAVVLLKNIRTLDEANQRALSLKKDEVREELNGVSHFNQALDGYQDSFGDSDKPRFFDGEY